jgi:hypothetical protein
MAVHYIDMEHRRAAAFHRANAISQAREVRGKDGRSNFDRIIHNFSADILPDSPAGLHRT